MNNKCHLRQRCLTRWMLPVLVMIVFVHNAVAQSQFGQITGLIADQNKSSIPGADITITNVDTGVENKAVTNQDGNYTVLSLVPGQYRITASKEGFSTVTQKGIVLQVAQTARVDLALQVGQVTQQVTVNASGEVLQTETADIGNVVSQSGVVNLPLNGRDYLTLATLVPGTNSAGLGQSYFGMPENNLNVNGMRQSATAYVIDGADVMEQFTSGSPYTPAPDAIQEFRVETNNMTAQYGGGGAIINVALKSGTNGFHGDAYDFLRNNALDARNYFSLTTPELRFNEFGGTIGGPIKKDKLFFFGDYQGTRIIQGITDDTPVPTAAELQGNFVGQPQINNPYTGQPVAGNQIPPNAISPQAAFFLNFIPAANSPGGTYVQTVNGDTTLDQYDIRIDAHLRDADLLAFTWSQEIGNVTTPGATPLNGGTSGPNKGEFTNVNWTHTFGSNRVNQANYSYTRETATETGQGIGTNYTVQAGIGGFEDTSLLDPGPPSITINGYTSPSGYTIDGYPFLPLVQVYNHYNVGDVFTDVIGRHSITFGGNARWYDGFNTNGAWSRGSFTFTGSYTGNPIADFLYGVPFNGERGFPRNEFGGYQRNQNLFIQDAWKLLPKLTVVAGFRWDLIHPTVAMDNMAASANPATNQIIVASNGKGQIDTTSQQLTAIVLPLFQSRIVTSSQMGLPNSLVFTNWDNVAPRLGVAYQLPWDSVVRAGFGIFFPLSQGNQTISTAGANPPFIVDQPENNTSPVPTETLATMFPPTTPGNYALGPVLNDETNARLPSQYIQEWNLAYQKSIKGVLSLQAAYVGSKGTHLPFVNPDNVPLPGPGTIQNRRQNTFFSEGYDLSDIGYSNYNSLQVTAETRSWHDLYFLATYTWGKSLDDMSAEPNVGSEVQDPNNLHAEYGISDYNLASRYTTAVTYQLPVFAGQSGLVRTVAGGWSLSSIINIQSGPVFTPSLSTDPANTGTQMRTNRIGNEGKLSNPSIQDWFNVAAFPVPAEYTYGNSARNVLTGPGLKDWDMGLFKTFVLPHLGENTKAQFRYEYFNLTNTPPFGLPEGDVQSPSAGQVLSASAPREAQVSLKILF
jgi:Carboxypeptidase regulatory-like domain